MDTLERQWRMLREIPREPRRISTEDIRARLASAGFDVTARTIQRDLVGLSRLFDLKSDERNKPYGWSWSKDSKVFDLPGMDAQTALTFSLVDQFLGGVLPPAVREDLSPHLKRARGLLNERLHRRWAERVRVIRSRQTLQAPAIDRAVLQTVYDALLQGRRIKAHYARPQTDPTDYSVNPLGIVFRDEAAYLVCTLFDRPDIRQLALHRIRQAELLEQPLLSPAGFDLDTYIRSGEFDWPVGGDIRLSATLDDVVAAYLAETPLSVDQKIGPSRTTGRFTMTATVQDTRQLRWWLLSFGDSIEVLKPAGLRRELGATLTRAAKRYRRR